MIEVSLKQRQQWVLRHPCRTVTECGRPGYRADLPIGTGHAATVLTVDLFSQPLAWHADIALLDIQGVGKPTAAWTDMDHAAALDLAKRLLAGVGVEAATQMEMDGLRIGLVRPLTVEEVAVALRLGEMRPAAPRPAIGEINEYDFQELDTRTDDGSHAPIERTLFYG